MAEQMTKPLRDVPVGAHVVYDGELWEVPENDDADARRVCVRKPGAAICWGSFNESTRVLHLDGSEPRPLTPDDIGRTVYVVDWEEHELPEPLFHVAVLLDHGSYESDQGFWVDPDWPVWPIVAPETAKPRWTVSRDGLLLLDGDLSWDDDGSSHRAVVTKIAEVLNAEGWTPEPDRPTVGTLAESAIRDACLRQYPDAQKMAQEHANRSVPAIRAAGITLVETAAASEVIDFLYEVVRDGPVRMDPKQREALRRFLDALGIRQPADSEVQADA